MKATVFSKGRLFCRSDQYVEIIVYKIRASVQVTEVIGQIAQLTRPYKPNCFYIKTNPSIRASDRGHHLVSPLCHRRDESRSLENLSI